MNSNNLYMIIGAERPEHWEFIRKVRNHALVTPGFIEQGQISKETHEKFMTEHHKNYRICIRLSDRKFLGFIGCVNNDIRIAVSPEYQGLGIGEYMLEYAKLEWPGAQVKIKIDNVASINLFRKAGYTVDCLLLSLHNKSVAGEPSPVEKTMNDRGRDVTKFCQNDRTRALERELSGWRRH
jgi:GNAT superfamily N-acetyltransferase